ARVVPQSIDRPTMGKAVNEQAPLIILHHLGFTSSVVRAFQGIGKRLTDKTIWIGKHLCDWHYAQVIKIKIDVGQEHSTVPRLDETERRHLRDVEPLRNLVSQLLVVPNPNFRCRFSKCVRAGGLGFNYTVPVIFGQWRRYPPGIHSLALDWFG